MSKSGGPGRSSQIPNIVAKRAAGFTPLLGHMARVQRVRARVHSRAILNQFLQVNLLCRTSPSRARHPSTEQRRTPIPYFTLLENEIEEASSKYFVGTEISPIKNPAT